MSVAAVGARRMCLIPRRLEAMSGMDACGLLLATLVDCNDQRLRD